MTTELQVDAEVTLSPPSTFLSPCSKFRILVLGNPEATKQELFSKVFGVELEKRLVSDTFDPKHNIESELDLQGQNDRLAVHASPNFLNGDQKNYNRVLEFLSRRSASADYTEHVHMIWYCVSTSEEDRGISDLEKHFFTQDITSVHVPVVLVYTKYDEFVSRVMLEWMKGAGSTERGVSKVAVGHILKDISSKKFEEDIGRHWNMILPFSIPRVCVSSGDEDDDIRSFQQLANSTLVSLKGEADVKLAFATAQRSSPVISTQFCAEAATDYYEVDTGHARKIHGVDMRDILPNFFAKAAQIFNLRDPSSVLTDPLLLNRVLDSTFGTHQKPLLAESLRRSGTESGNILLSLSPHERAVLLTQALSGIVLFLHMLADSQWSHAETLPTLAPLSPGYTFSTPTTPHFPSHSGSVNTDLSQRQISRELEDLRLGTGKSILLDTIESSSIFTECQLKQDISELILKAVTLAEKSEITGAGENNYRFAYHQHHDAMFLEGGYGGDEDGVGKGTAMGDSLSAADMIRDMSMTFVNDNNELREGTAGEGKVKLACGLTILPLN
ncbi:uncharacterized protein QC763_701300 [Podospora pseudopauciseta]|uniref:G domain-containing protein n=2 Tax=Podospora TaxID=5144 RepID=A0ABR0H2X1_9PEZI|nr:hypothetical protein QC763_701300 [Podospora pseudopauciseta]KAK4668944.1 hypothetical protein QC764_701300 [Podospora pseudoanserina]